MNLNNINNLIKYDCISENRTILMGIAILSVMTLHSCGWANIELTRRLHIVNICCSLLFTNAFLFLSGFGLAFSLNKGNDLKSFYNRRIKRLVLPFMIMALPFYIYRNLIIQPDVLTFILNETTLYNFIYKNNGMWYIAASFLMYFLSPYLFNAIERRKNKHVTAIVLSLPFMLLALCIYLLFPEYSKGTSILWDKLWIFVLGIFIGYQTLTNKIGGVVINC